jgi:hypothetical protein
MARSRSAQSLGRVQPWVVVDRGNQVSHGAGGVTLGQGLGDLGLADERHGVGIEQFGGEQVRCTGCSRWPSSAVSRLPMGVGLGGERRAQGVLGEGCGVEFGDGVGGVRN